MTTWLSQQRPEKLLKDLDTLTLPAHHDVRLGDVHPRSLSKILVSTYEAQAATFEQLLEMPGVGGATLRALSLIGELIYNAPASRRDPVKYSFTVGGKDGFPYPVNRKAYDESIEVMHKALQASKLGHTEKVEAFRRLAAV